MWLDEIPMVLFDKEVQMHESRSPLSPLVHIGTRNEMGLGELITSTEKYHIDYFVIQRHFQLPRDLSRSCSTSTSWASKDPDGWPAYT